MDFQSSQSRMLYLSWVDTKPVNMLSTVHTSAMVPACKGSQRLKPNCVVEYNVGMKAVDLGDQLASYPLE